MKYLARHKALLRIEGGGCLIFSDTTQGWDAQGMLEKVSTIRFLFGFPAYYVVFREDFLHGEEIVRRWFHSDRVKPEN